MFVLKRIKNQLDRHTHAEHTNTHTNKHIQTNKYKQDNKQKHEKNNKKHIDQRQAKQRHSRWHQ